MKKLKLNLSSIEGAEILTRSQLKSVIGGNGGSGNDCPGGCFQNFICENGFCVHDGSLDCTIFNGSSDCYAHSDCGEGGRCFPWHSECPDGHCVYGFEN